MSFQAYLDAITRISGMSIDAIKIKMEHDQLLKKDLTNQAFVTYLNQTFNLGKGHSMALWKYAIEHQWFQTKHTTMK